MGLTKRIEAILDPSGGVTHEVEDDVEVMIAAKDLRFLNDVYQASKEQRSAVFSTHGSRPARRLMRHLWACVRLGTNITPDVEETRLLAQLLPEYGDHLVLVPSEITEPMISAWQSAFNAQLNKRTGRGRISSFYKRLRNEPAEVAAYRAMLAVAPKSMFVALPGVDAEVEPRDPVRHALLLTIEGLLTQIPKWLPPAPVESYGDEDGVGYSIRKETAALHLTWMLTHCIAHLEEWPIDKTSRWIGYVQGVLACKSKDFSVAAERDRTRPFFHTAYAATGQAKPTTAEGPR